jgi:MHS family proline/betaine transporter-like MFS transporter
MKKQVTLCTLGTIFEWYEFSLFACLTPILSQIFFQDSDPTAALIATFAIFASGYIMRPLGAVFFGQIGDRYGRKQALLITIFAMTIATTAIGLIPTGFNFSIALLVVCRLVQGFATSGEYPGGLTFLAEQQNVKHPSFIASFGIFGTGAGCFAGAVAYLLLLTTLGQESIIAWGWRIPFLLGAPLGIIGYLFRKYTLESPDFTSLQKSGAVLKIPIVNLFRDHFKTLLSMLCISILTNTLVYINFLYFGTYLLSLHKLSTTQVIYLNLMVTFIFSIAILFFGYLADYINKKIILLCGCLLLVASSYYLVDIILHGTLTSQFIAQAMFSILLGMILGPFASLLPAHFPTALRYTGVSVTVNFAAAFFGGTAPMICSWLTNTLHSPLAPAFYVTSLAVLASIACLLTFASSISPIEQPAISATGVVAQINK